MRASFWSVASLCLLVSPFTSIGLSAQSDGSCLMPPQGLVSWWPGDGNKSDVVGQNDASESDAVGFAQGQVGDGFSFGTHGYMKIPASATLANQVFTWTAWVRPDGPGPTNDAFGSVILGQVAGGQGMPTSSIQLAWREKDSKFLFLFGNPAVDRVVSEDPFPQGSFYFIAGEYDGTHYQLFVNGALEGNIEVKKSVPYSETAAWLLGQGGMFALDTHPRTWKGVIDEVQAFNRPLRQSELEAIYKAGSKGQCKTQKTIQMAKENRKDVAQPSHEQASGSLGGGIVDYLSRATQQMLSQPQKSDIRIPPGASPQFATFPADMRAILQPEAPLIHGKTKLPCETSDGISAAEALEIGRFAYRAADFSRGYCWIKRSADMGNVRAEVIVGASNVMGWGVERNPDAAFHIFKGLAETGVDPWAVYYLSQCYQNGFGTARDPQMAARYNSWLMMRSEGQAVFMSIGADDAEQWRAYQRITLLMDPPMKDGEEHCSLSADHQLLCAKDEVVDEDALQRELRSINH